MGLGLGIDHFLDVLSVLLFEGEGLSVHALLTWILALDYMTFPKFLEWVTNTCFIGQSYNQ